jgi:hypothetical protein
MRRQAAPLPTRSQPLTQTPKEVKISRQHSSSQDSWSADFGPVATELENPRFAPLLNWFTSSAVFSPLYRSRVANVMRQLASAIALPFRLSRLLLWGANYESLKIFVWNKFLQAKSNFQCISDNCVFFENNIWMPQRPPGLFLLKYIRKFWALGLVLEIRKIKEILSTQDPVEHVRLAYE